MDAVTDFAALPTDPAGAALRGPQRHLAVGGDGPALRYVPEVSPFGSLGSMPAAAAWEALAALPGDVVALFAQPGLSVPAGWTLMREIPVLEMALPATAVMPAAGEDPEVAPLTEADVPEMLDLTARTQPGPFLSATIAFGGYVGIRRDRALVAMAGRRLHLDGWIEISAVCSDPAHRGAGLGRRVTAAVAAQIQADGARPFLHAVPTNPARHLYAAMGFELVRETSILVVVRG